MCLNCNSFLQHTAGDETVNSDRIMLHCSVYIWLYLAFCIGSRLLREAWFCFYCPSNGNKTIKMGELSSITCWNWNFSHSHRVTTNFTKNIKSNKTLVFVRNSKITQALFPLHLNFLVAFKVESLRKHWPLFI